MLLEAAASGLAIIATNVGGTPEIFPPEENAARLVPPDDAGALGDAILELLGDPTMRHRLGIAARRRAEQQFDIRISVGNLLEHYGRCSTSRVKLPFHDVHRFRGNPRPND